MRLAASVTNRFFKYHINLFSPLRGLPEFRLHDGLVVILQIITLIGHIPIGSLRNQVLRMILLEKLIPLVGFVVKDVKDAGAGERLPVPGLDSDIHHPPLDFGDAFSLRIKHEDEPYRFSVLVGNQLPVQRVIPKNPVIPQVVLAAFDPFPLSPPHVFRYGSALALRNGGHQGKEEIAAGIVRPEVLLLKLHRYILQPQQVRVLLALGDVAGKPGDALAKDQLDVPVKCLPDHPHELRPFFGAQTGNAVGVHPGKLPVGI